jgi:regulator of sigma E protease
VDLQFLWIIPILSVLLVAHELGHFFTARWAGITVEEFGVGLPPRLLGIKRGGVIYSLNAIPFGAFVRMLGEEDPTHPGSFARKPKLVRMGVLAAGSAMNFLLAVVAFAVAFATGVPTIVNETAIRVVSVAENSPAQAAGLQVGDLIYTIGGRPAVPLEQFRQITTENGGKPTALEVERDGARTQVMVTPRANPPKDQGAMGIAIQPHGTVGPQRYSIPESLWMGVTTAGGVVLTTLSIPVLLINGVITPEVARPIGLPGMAQAAGQAASASMASGWWYPVLALTGFISAGLSLANMLPLPALDGGRFLFVIIEAIRGRRISPEREAAVHFVGLVALLALMILISINDLNSPLPAIDWGVR